MSYTVERSMNREEVEALLHELMPSKNLFYAIRMDGTFREVNCSRKDHVVRNQFVLGMLDGQNCNLSKFVKSSYAFSTSRNSRFYGG